MNNSLRQFQLEETEMLKKLCACLQENDIPFYLIGGSCLGVLRHQGFIPWDDDIDIGIFRRDFEKAQSVLTQLPADMLYDRAEKHIIADAPIGHLYKNRKPLEDAPRIDIFAIDTIPDSFFGRKIQKVCSVVYHICVLRRPAQNRGKIKKALTAFICKAFPDFVLDILQRIAYKGLTYWQNSNEKCVSNIYGVKGSRETVPREFYGKARYELFEGVSVPIPEKAEEYMTHIYGNYMEYPPEKDRVPVHFGKVINSDEGYKSE